MCNSCAKAILSLLADGETGREGSRARKTGLFLLGSSRNAKDADTVKKNKYVKRQKGPLQFCNDWKK